MTSTEQTAVDLLPCPFCGGRGTSGEHMDWIACDDCGATGATADPHHPMTKAEAWNRRDALARHLAGGAQVTIYGLGSGVHACDTPLTQPAAPINAPETYSKSIDAQPAAQECRCNMRTKLVGDGCAVCNPEKWADMLRDDEPAAQEVGDDCEFSRFLETAHPETHKPVDVKQLTEALRTHRDSSYFRMTTLGQAVPCGPDAPGAMPVFRNKGDSEAQFAADSEHLNCPTCGGSGHADDTTPQATPAPESQERGAVARMTGESRVPDDWRAQADGYRAGWNDRHGCPTPARTAAGDAGDAVTERISGTLGGLWMKAAEFANRGTEYDKGWEAATEHAIECINLDLAAAPGDVRVPEHAILERAFYHRFDDDYDIYAAAERHCDNCIPVLIVRADAATPQPGDSGRGG
jgi:hypothetical protein